MARGPEHGGAAATAKPKPAAAAAGADDIEAALANREVGYAHAVMMQCFLPQKPVHGREYKTSHGRASLVVEAGLLANPGRAMGWTRCGVPSGPKPRLILPCIIGEAVRSGSPVVDQGHSLRNFIASIHRFRTIQTRRFRRRTNLGTMALAHGHLRPMPATPAQSCDGGERAARQAGSLTFGIGAKRFELCRAWARDALDRSVVPDDRTDLLEARWGKTWGK